MSDENKDGQARIPTNQRTLLIIEALAKAGTPLSPTEINQNIGLPKQTIHRLCHTLVEEGFLSRDTDPKRLRPTRRLREIASGIFTASRSHIARHQVLEDISAQIQETVNFVMPEEKGMTYVDRVETDWPFRIHLPVGSHVPFHCTASGKCFLAYLSMAQRESLVDVLRFDPVARNTHRDAHSLKRDLDQILDQGYAVDNEEFMDGMVAVAAPVRNPSGQFFAAIAFHAPTQRLTIDDAIARKNLLIKGAERLREVLFF